MTTVTKGLWVPLEAKPGKEADVARFLEGARAASALARPTVALVERLRPGTNAPHLVG